MTNKLVVILDSLKVPKIKKLLLYEMKFLVTNYSCLPESLTTGLPPTHPCFLCSQLNLLNPNLPRKNSSVCHWKSHEVVLTVVSWIITIEGQNVPDALRTIITIRKTRDSEYETRECHLIITGGPVVVVRRSLKVIWIKSEYYGYDGATRHYSKPRGERWRFLKPRVISPPLNREYGMLAYGRF